MKRLSTAGRAVGIEADGGFARVREMACETTRAWGGRREGYLRSDREPRRGRPGHRPGDLPRSRRSSASPPARSALDPEKAARGLDLVTSSLRRPAGDVLDPRVKSLNYLNNVLAKREANLRGADDALVLNARGLIAESSATNVFALTA